MAITHVQTVGKVTSTNTVTVPAGGCAQGNTLILWLFSNDGTAPTYTISDSQSNTYVVDIQKADTVSKSASIARGYLSTALTSSDTITISGTASSRQFVVHEFSGIASSSPLDKTTSATNVGTSVDSGTTAALSGSTDLYVAAEANATAVLTDTTGGLTAVTNDFDQYHGRYAILASSSAVNYQGSLASSVRWAAVVATYQPPAGGATSGSASGGVNFPTAILIN